MKTIKPLLEYMAEYANYTHGDIETFAIIDMLEELKNQVNANTEAIEKLKVDANKRAFGLF